MLKSQWEDSIPFSFQYFNPILLIIIKGFLTQYLVSSHVWAVLLVLMPVDDMLRRHSTLVSTSICKRKWYVNYEMKNNLSENVNSDTPKHPPKCFNVNKTHMTENTKHVSHKCIYCLLLLMNTLYNFILYINDNHMTSGGHIVYSGPL